MMYAFGNRADCAVVDEPLYAAYLSAAGVAHPMQAEILAAQSQDPAEVIAGLMGPNPDGKPHFYQKHMTQHMVPGVPRDWMSEVANVFRIRHPARVNASYAAKRENPTLDDIGFWQQAELFEVIGLDWDPAMLSWPKGGHKDDGVWASHWYGSVWNFTGFAGAAGPLPVAPAHLRDVLDAALPFYERLKAEKISL